MPAYIVKIRKREDLNNISGIQKAPTTVYKIRLNNSDNTNKNNNLKINNNFNNNNNPHIIKCSKASIHPLSGSNNHNMVVSNSNKLVVSKNGTISGSGSKDSIGSILSHPSGGSCIVKSGGYVVSSGSSAATIVNNNSNNLVLGSSNSMVQDIDLEDSLRPLGLTLEKHRTLNLEDITKNKMCTLIGRNGHNKVEDVIDEILNLEEGLEVTDNLKVYDNNMGPSNQMNSGSICDLLGLNGYMGKNGTGPCSPDEEPQIKAEATPVNEQHIVAFMKDRQKKDNHNMIERRRRYNINDRIKELATLLPRTNEPYFELVRDLRHNKGQILKASVDYIRRLKIDTDYNKEVEAKRRALEQQNRQLHLRIQELENQLRNSGINVDETAIDQSLLLSSIIKTEMVNSNNANSNKNNTDSQNDMKKVRCSISNITGTLLDQVFTNEDSSEHNKSDIDDIIGSALHDGSMYLIPPGAPESPPYEFTELLEDFTSGGFNLDLMDDDDGPAFTSDPVFSSPQVSSPNSSHHSFDDALTPDSMDIQA